MSRAELSNLSGSERLIFEPLSADHAKLLFSSMQDPVHYNWISSTPPVSITALEKKWAQAAVRSYAKGENILLNWAVRRRLDGVWIGKLDADINCNNTATNIGYLFFSQFWGQGYATEA